MDGKEEASLPGRLVLVEQNNNFGVSIEGMLAKMHLMPQRPVQGTEAMDMTKTIIHLQ